MITETREKRPFKFGQNQIFRSAVELLTPAENSSSGYSVHTDFTKSDQTDRMYALFTGTGLTGPLKAKENDCVHMVLFVTAMVDSGCRTIDASGIICFVKHV